MTTIVNKNKLSLTALILTATLCGQNASIKNIKVEETPKIIATIVDNKVTSAASIGLFPPIALATKACVPVAVAMSTACKKKNILCPVPTAAMASVPKEPTAFRATILTKANKMLLRIDGQARPHTDRVSGLDGESTSSSFALLSIEFKFLSFYPSRKIIN